MKTSQRVSIEHDHIAFISRIGCYSEPSQAGLFVGLAKQFWEIYPKIHATDTDTGCSIAETNVRTAFALINRYNRDETLDQEQLLLAALDRNIGWTG